mgnify:CR=1 FL=1
MRRLLNYQGASWRSWLWSCVLVLGFSLSFTNSVQGQCPPGAVCDTLTSGDIASDYDFNTAADFPAACLGSLTVTIPAGNWVDSVSTSYDMTAANGAWMSEQRTWLYSPNTLTGEPSVASGSGTTAGTFSYARSGLTFASTATGSVTIELHVGRTWGGSGCDASFNQVDNNTWEIIVYHSPAPSCLPPSAPQFLGASSTAANFSWTASTGSNGYEYELRTSGAPGSGPTGLAASGTVTGTSVTATGLSPQTNYDFYVRSTCGGTSGNSPWTAAVSALTACTVFAAPFNENFDNTANWASRTTIDPCWTANPSAGSTWSWEPRSTAPTSGNGPLADLTGGNFLYCEASIFGNFPPAEFTTPLIDVSSLTSPALYFHQHRFSGATIADMDVEVTNDFGATWTTLYSVVGDVQTSSADAWTQEFINLGSYTGDTVQIRFKQSYNGCCGDAAIDSIVVDEAPACPWPNNFASLSTSATSATFSWLDPGGSSWDIEFGAPGFPQGTGTVQNVSSNPGTITGLTAGTTYEAYIRSNCTASSNGTSIWIGPVQFTTLCNIFTAPLTENFDGTSWVASGNNAGNQLDPCWIAWPPASDGTEPFKWIPRSTAPTSGNGPSADVTGGNYLYCEASGSAAGDSAWIQSPAVDVSGLTTPAVYFEQHRFSNGGSIADMKVQISNDFGATWNTEYTITGEVQTALADPYQLVFVNLGAYTGDTIIVRFQQDGNGCCGDAAIDKVEIKEAPTCPWPTGQQIVAVTDTTATLGWNDPSGTDWDLEWGPVGFTQGTGSVTSVTNDTVTFGPLSPNTCYDVYVRGNCTGSSNGVSIWRGPIQFCTLCQPLGMTYTNDFDADPVGEVPDCWNAFLSGPSANSSAAEVEAGTFNPPNSSPNHVRFYNFNNDTTWLISPQFSDLPGDTGRISFFARTTSSFSTNNDLYIGTIASLTDRGSFTVIDTIALTTTWTQYNLDVTVANGYNGSHEYIVLSHEGQDFTTYNIDDFVYEPIPACVPPLASSLGISGASTTQATATWGSGSQGVKTYFAWGAVGFVPQVAGQLGLDSVPGTIDQGTITGLGPQTTYEFYIQDSCVGSGLSPWIGPFTFTTPCLPATMPYHETFDTWALSCWDSAGGNSFWTPYDAGGGDQYARADFWANSTGTYHLTSRPIAITQDAQVRFYWSHLYNNFYPDDQLLVMVKTLSATSWDTIVDLKGPNDFNDPSAGNFNTPGNFLEEAVVINPAVYTGDTIQVKIVANSDFGPDCFVNDLFVEPAPSCPDLANLSATNITITGADLGWNPSPNAQSYEVWYGPQGFFQGTQTAGGTVVTSSTNPTSVSALMSSTCYEFLVRSVCSPGDTSDWVGPFVFCTPCVAVTMPYYESFDNWPLTCWDETGGSANWLQFTGPAGDNYAEANFWGLPNDSLFLTSPAVILSVDAQVRFDWSHLYSTAYPNDQLLVLVKKVSATTWDTVVNLIGPNNFNDPTAGNSNTPGSFITNVTPLDPGTYTGDTVQVLLKAISDFGPDCFVNDFYVEAVPTCPAPNSLAVANITANAADVSWTAATGNPAANFEVSFGAGISAPAAGTTQLISGTSGTITGLSSNTNYCYYVREICAPGDSSNWEGPLCFSTTCLPVLAPYAEDFTNNTVGHWDGADNCWDFISNNPGTSSSGGYSWEVRNTPQTTSGTSTGPAGDNTNYPATGGTFITADVSGSGTGDSTLLVSPIIDLSLLSAPELEYHLHRYGTQMADFYVDLYDGSQWVNGVHSFTNQTGAQTATTDPYKDTIIDLSPYIGLSNFRVRFRSVSNGCCAGDNALDDVSIYDASPGCVTPANIAHNVYRCDSVDVSWNSGAAMVSSVIEYGPTGFTPGAGTIINNASSPQALPGLNASTNYDVYIIDICATDTSSPAGPYTFNTGTSGAPSASYTTTLQAATLTGRSVTFDGSASTSAGAGATYTWDYGDGNSGTGVTSTHTYSTNGTYTACLVVSNNCGTDTTCQSLVIEEIGIAELLLTNSLEIYPNPAHDIINVSFESSLNGDVTLRLLDAQGREVLMRTMETESQSFEGQLFVKALSRGMYILEIETGELKARRSISLQ